MIIWLHTKHSPRISGSKSFFIEQIESVDRNDHYNSSE